MTDVLVNDKRFADFMKQVTSLGNEAGLGKDSLPKLAVAVVQQAADGVIELDTKNKDGHDIAQVIYERYVQAEGKKTLHEMTNGGKKGNISKLRQLIAMGLMTTVDGTVVIDAAFQARKRMAEPTLGNKVKPAYAYYVDVAREQLKSSTPLDDAALEALALKEEAEDKTLIGELKRVQKILDGLVSGENKSKIKDQDPLVIAAQEAIAERVAALVNLEARIELEQMAAKLGLKLA